jgi:hypothetical protein
MLKVSIFETLQQNRHEAGFSVMLFDVMAI